MQKDVVICATARTPIGSFNGALANVPVAELAATAITAAMQRAQLTPEQIDEVILGCVLTAGKGQNLARQAAIQAGIPVTTPSFTINKVCGSGLKSVVLAAQAISCGDASVVIAGGMENMSSAAYALDKARTGYRMGHGQLTDTMIRDALTDDFEAYHMGITAENVASQYNISRADQDAFALRSQQKTAAAISNGLFADEICPVTVKTKKTSLVIDTDEYPKPDTSSEGLSGLRSAFIKEGTVTAGNASGINDGAAAVVLMSAETARQLGVQPLARIVAYASGGVEPSVMGTGPVPAVRKALQKAGWQIDDIDCIEANEAFASQSLAVGRELGFDPTKVNIHGGAIALGHPVGASGTRILTTLIHILHRYNKKRGLATLCIGGGQGICVLVERLGGDHG